VSGLRTRLWAAAGLGWKIESNWADPFVFVVYALLRPVGQALILSGIYWTVSGEGARPEVFAGFYLANAFHEYVVRVLVGMGWMVVEEREDYETLRFLCVSPVGLRTYLAGRSLVKFGLATFSVALVLAIGVAWLGLRFDPARIPWIPFALAMALGLVATLFLGYLAAGWALLLPRVAVSMNEGIGVVMYLVCGVIFPVDLLPRGMQELSLALPFTWWYEALRRFLLGEGVSARLGALGDGQLLAGLAATTAALAVVSHVGFGLLERRARRLGRIDQATTF
jgi:ABC-2 type transport system permease protein